MTAPTVYIPEHAVDATLDEKLRALFSACFTGPHDGRFKTQRFFNEMPQHRWLVREPGRVIAHVAIHDKTIGTQSGEFPIAGVSEVATHPDFRGKGLVRQLLAAAHGTLAARGVPFAVLFGNWKVYSSSGYFPVSNPLRYLDSARNEWLVNPISGAMARQLGAAPWPAGEIDLRGPMF